MGEGFGAVGRDQHSVFEADGGFAGEVDAGFEEDDHVGLEDVVAAGDEAGASWPATPTLWPVWWG